MKKRSTGLMLSMLILPVASVTAHGVSTYGDILEGTAGSAVPSSALL